MSRSRPVLGALLLLISGCLSLDGLDSGSAGAAGRTRGGSGGSGGGRTTVPDGAADGPTLSDAGATGPTDSGANDPTAPDSRGAQGSGGTELDGSAPESAARPYVPDPDVDDGKGVVECRSYEPVFGLDMGTVGASDALTPATMAEIKSRGIRLVLVQLEWSKIQPDSQAAFDDTQLAAAKAQISRWMGQGVRVALDLGVHSAPSWVLSKTCFKADDAAECMSAVEPNLVWNGGSLRTNAECYIRHVFVELADVGQRIDVVRVGGGRGGALTYPWNEGSDGESYAYFAFDTSAAMTNPVPDWQPGTVPSDPETPRRFLDWYLKSLANYQDWQVRSVRAHFAGTIAVDYPWGTVDENDIQAAIASNLDGTSRAERSGELQRGRAPERLVAHLAMQAADGGEKLAVWAGATEKGEFVDKLATLARQYGFDTIGQNSPSLSASDMRRAIENICKNKFSYFVWYDKREAYCDACPGVATILDYQTAIGLSRPE